MDFAECQDNKKEYLHITQRKTRSKKENKRWKWETEINGEKIKELRGRYTIALPPYQEKITCGNAGYAKFMYWQATFGYELSK